MGITTPQYRQSIGLFNNAKFIKCCCCIKCIAVPVVIFTLVLITLLLFMSGTLELNPGPIQTPRVKNLNICHVNIRGLNVSKLRAIKTTLCQNFDIITISETLLSVTTPNSELQITGFHEIIRRDRQQAGGGVAVYVRECIAFQRRVEFETDTVEQIWLQINTKEGKLMICNCYRPPNYGNFWGYLSTNIEDVKSGNPNVKYFILLGDFNADFASVNGRHLLDICSVYNLQCLVNEPTRITATTETCLDQILVNMPNFVKTVHVTPPISTNDHCTVAVELSFKLPKEKPYYRLVWQYNNGDLEGFKNSLSHSNWEDCFQHNDVDHACSTWSEMFLNIARTHIPNKMVLIRPRDSPWYSNNLRVLKRQVDRLYKKAKRIKTVLSWDRYKRSRNQYQASLDEAEKQYQKGLSQSLATTKNTKTWWSTVKNMLGRGGEESYPAMKNPHDNTDVCDNKEKAELFNKFFLSHNKIDPTNVNLPNAHEIPNHVLGEIVATEDEVLELIMALDTSKATGPDGISPQLLKAAGKEIVPSLTRLINLSLSTCKVPQSWKLANVIPIYKKGEKDQLNNYRPISLLPTVSKILEKIVFKHVYNFMHTHDILSKHQSGFRPGDSTVNQLAYMYHIFCEALDKKKDIRLVFCDVSKAFDKVWHDGLLYKLQKIGIIGNLLNWFRNYLTNRKQRVIIKGQSSEWGVIEAGVPQGSNLGPLLFVIFINDIVEAVNCNIKLFADDTCLYVLVDDDPQESANKLNENLDNVKEWARQWVVDFNAAKTKAMTISNRSLDHPSLSFNNTELDEVQCHKHLGVTLSSKLTWTKHIDNIIASVSKMLDVTRMIKYDVDRESLETIYFSYMRPKMEYACQVWDCCTLQDSDKLENLQLYAARIVTGAKRGTSHEMLYEEVRWPKLADRRTNIKLNLMHKIVNGNVPNYLSEVLPNLVGENLNYELRNRHNISGFKCRTEKFRKSFFPDSVQLWNNLDPTVKCITDRDAFNKSITNICSKSKKLFNYGQRGVNIIHAQLRLQCSNLKAHLFALHVIEDAQCACNYWFEDTNHFFFQCPLYHIHRQELVNTVQQICRIDLDILLFGNEALGLNENKKIFAAVHKYILASNRL